MTHIALKTRIMLGVYVLYVVRRIRSPFVGELFVLGISFAILSFLVSLPHVISNIILTRGSYVFLFDAFQKADMVVELIVLSAFISGCFFVRNITLFTTEKFKNRLA